MRRRTLILIIVIVAVAVVFFFWWLSQPPYPWLFKGAYAEYEGSTIVGFVPATVKLRLQVLDYNRTHAEILFHLEANALGVTQKEDEVEWVPLGTPFESNGVKVYEKTIYIERLGARDCIVCEQHEKDTTIILYVDKQVMWPIQITLIFEEEGQTTKIVMPLTYTNIPELMKP